MGQINLQQLEANRVMSNNKRHHKPAEADARKVRNLRQTSHNKIHRRRVQTLKAE